MSSAGPFAAFAVQFFETFEQAAVWHGERLHVALDEGLAAQFGTEKLILAFTPHDPEGELVAYGSRLFEEMLALLAGRGRWTGAELPTRHPAPTPPRLINGTVEDQGAVPAPRVGYVINFQLAFLADERVERLLSVCLDEAGAPAPEIAGWWEKARGGEPAPHLAPPGPAAIEAAERFALREAEAWALPMEREGLERLRKVGAALVDYYEQLIVEVSPKRRRGQSEADALAEFEELKATLRGELSRKLHDETARHQLRVQVRRLSQAAIAVPGHTHAWRLATSDSARLLAVWHNAHTGHATWPDCERCAQPPEAYGLCAEGHLTCESCLGACGGCARDICATDLRSCGCCAVSLCASCLSSCPAGHAVCARHLQSCPLCGQVKCEACGDSHACGVGR